MNRKERPKKTAGKSRANEMIFEIWQVIKPVSADSPFNHWPPNFDALNHWPPFGVAEPEKNLSKICMKKYGPGEFVALHLAESRMGFPLSHWVVKVRSPELHDAARVHPDANYLAVVREQYTAYGNEPGEGLYRRREAALTSLCLQELEEPKARKVKASRRRRRPENAWAMQLIELYGDKETVIEKLIEKGRGNTEWGWERKSDHALETAAKRAYNAGRVALNREKKLRKPVTFSKKKSGV